jgi:hypothetical protein
MNTQIADNRFLQAVAQDAMNTPVLKAAAAEGPEAFGALFASMLPGLMQQRLERDAELAFSLLGGGNAYNGGTTFSSERNRTVTDTLSGEVWQQARVTA